MALLFVAFDLAESSNERYFMLDMSDWFHISAHLKPRTEPMLCSGANCFLLN